jgi:hypothetical protein
MKYFLLALILLCTFQLKAFASAKNDSIIAYTEYTCWLDTGPKNILFSDGTAYIFKPEQVDKIGRTKLHALQTEISKQSFKDLVNVFTKNYFINVPKEVVSDCMDGNDIFVYFATPAVYHKVHQYMAPNESLNLIGQHIVGLQKTLRENATEVTLTTILSDLRQRMNSFAINSSQHKCLQEFLYDFTRHLVACQQVDSAQVKDLMHK